MTLSVTIDITPVEVIAKVVQPSKAGAINRRGGPFRQKKSWNLHSWQATKRLVLVLHNTLHVDSSAANDALVDSKGVAIY